MKERRMMINIELNSVEEINQAVEPDENLLNFLEYTISLISEARSAQDVDLLMDDFIANDMTELLSENKYMFRVLSVIWLNTFKRVFMQSDEKSFPVNVLWLPVLFKKLGWELKDKSHLNNLFQTCLASAEDNASLYDYMCLLFIDGLLNSPKDAYPRFEGMIKGFDVNDLEKQKLDSLLTEIKSLGWQ